ncbi:MAG: methylenetetrahydrofolate reductase [Candidatus Thermoplasmatota archaeon]|jgi:methylenetetrahydrofolate reductase (NADPH)|nr:methylenetetrahydrofolate reductase [Candidatus Thermoplasmatota archaeon]
MGYRSNLEKALSERGFAVTVEIGPPKGCDPARIREKGEMLRGCADAFNVTDNQTAVVRMSSMAGCCILLGMGLEPVMQMSCRDRNRIALQSDVLGADAMGIRNILCVTGDHQCFGNHPGSKGVYDLDSVQLIKIIRDMRDKGVFQSGDEVSFGKPEFFIGAAANPFSDPCELMVDHLEKKVVAGAEFVQTQSVFNLDRFVSWMDEVCSRGLDKKVHILAGVTPLKSLKMAERMKFHVPGVDLPDDIFNRIKDSKDQMREGYEISLELIEQVKKIRGVHGLHITALFWESIIPSIVRESGIYHM